jgi:hypothetical protein
MMLDWIQAYQALMLSKNDTVWVTDVDRVYPLVS